MKNLSLAARSAWDYSVAEAVSSGSMEIEKEHLFIGLLSIDKIVTLGRDGLSAELETWTTLKSEHDAITGALRKYGLNMRSLRRTIRGKLVNAGYQHVKGVIHRSADCKEHFKKAESMSGSPELTAIDLLCTVLVSAGDIITPVILKAGADTARLSTEIRGAFYNMKAAEPPETPLKKAIEEASPLTPMLDRYGRDLTREAREGRLGPFVGRRGELLEIIRTLAMATKNNPVIIGEAGVGKTAVVEALAMRVVEGKDADVLSGRRIVELNLGALEGGTRYRGEFEERITKIIAEAKADPRIIVFIDEIHNLIGSGRVEGSMDGANLLKPSLARGDFRCIGATTIAEYRRYVEKDPALERRFEKVFIAEPTRDEAIDMLKGRVKKWEGHHGVTVEEDALIAAVDYSIRFDTDRKLPDKAIDIIDKACARARVPLLSMGPGGNRASRGRLAAVTVLIVAQVVCEKTGVPLEIITGHGSGSNTRISELPAFLKLRVIGQDSAIDAVCARLKVAYAGLSRRSGPIAVFLLLGPTGVGKTELVKSMSEFLFGSETPMIRLDMSEFMEEHSVSKLIGTPPGYVGYEDEGQLTGKLRTRPYSIVLLDEVEKAHQRVFDIFLQLFDEGRLTDSKGRTIDAKNAIFVMTSNIGAHDVEANKPLGFVESESAGKKRAGERAENSRMEALAGFFRPEFLNRIDEVVLFSHLEADIVKNICKKIIDGVANDFSERTDAVMEITDDALSFIAQSGFNRSYGVRELNRAVDKLLRIPLGELILAGDVAKGGVYRVWVEAGGIVIRRD